MRARVLLSVAMAVWAVAPSFATSCENEVTIGNFLYEFKGATYDGKATTFDYCVTGLDNPGFHALSNWELSLDIDCIRKEDLVGCGPEPCFYQENDPNTGITGIKFDDLEVDKGETECFFFSLAGDWTGSIDDVTVGLKAAGDVSFGTVCGPTCQGCELSVAMDPNQVKDAVPVMHLYLVHNRPTDAKTGIRITVRDSAGKIYHRWESAQMTFKDGVPFKMDSPIPGMALPPPGIYTVRVQLKDMTNMPGKVTKFEVLPR